MDNKLEEMEKDHKAGRNFVTHDLNDEEIFFIKEILDCVVHVVSYGSNHNKLKSYIVLRPGKKGLFE